MKLDRQKTGRRHLRSAETAGVVEAPLEFDPLVEIDIQRLVELAGQQEAPAQEAVREEVYFGAWVARLSPHVLDALRTSPWLRQAWSSAIREVMDSSDLAAVPTSSHTVTRALEFFSRFVQIFPEERQHAPFSSQRKNELAKVFTGDLYDEIISRGVALIVVYPKDYEVVFSDLILNSDTIGNYRAHFAQEYAKVNGDILKLWNYYCSVADFLLLFPNQRAGLADQIRKDAPLLQKYIRRLRHDGTENAEYRYNNQLYFLTLLLAEDARIEQGEVLFNLPARRMGRSRPLPPRPLQVEVDD